MFFTRKWIVLSLALFFGSLVVPSTEAQVSLVRLKVTKKQSFQQERSSSDWVDATTGKRLGTAHSSVSYKAGAALCQVEILNNSTKNLQGLQVKWALLLNPPGKQPKFIEGDAVCTAEVGRKCNIETEALPLDKSKLKDLGYYVEVSLAGESIATESDPPGTKERIDEIKATTEKKK